MQHPGPVDEALPELQISQIAVHSSLDGHNGHNLTKWYSDI